jgi:hypothetical protein
MRVLNTPGDGKVFTAFFADAFDDQLVEVGATDYASAELVDAFVGARARELKSHVSIARSNSMPSNLDFTYRTED